MNVSSLATLSTGVSPIASARYSAVASAASAFVANTTMSTSRTASSFAAPRAPISAAFSRARSRVARADHDVLARVHEPMRKCEPEIAGPADDRDPHAPGRLSLPPGGAGLRERLTTSARR